VKKTLIIIFSVLILGTILIVWVLRSVPDLNPEHKVVSINFGSYGNPLYLESETWGLTNDHSFTILSDRKGDITEDSLRAFLYKQADFLFYRTNADTLWLYVYKRAPKPTLFKSKIKVVEIELENPDMIVLKRTHKYNGKEVEEFSAF